MFQAKRAFSGVSEFVLEKLANDQDVETLEGEFTDIEWSDQLALALMMHFIPDLNMTSATLKMLQLNMTSATLKMLQRGIDEDPDSSYLDFYDVEAIHDVVQIGPLLP
jgi:glutamine synthetase adenylyltransferase